jgi:hypothetical protein
MNSLVVPLGVYTRITVSNTIYKNERVSIKGNEIITSG